ncbi:DUF2459 domain-containing protein [Caldovatus aquaticus]|uniref:DUF2459 domain-containing protein n=1 Tax=Caldovatus aquaticus TaxID=2865671 RepID=A0ABS7F2C8_9PROT|nr:DUF2459 domain-containing protein [Caldovatus aquaticus]MBW8269473.1 DUF2459 domain-containing protein [Caldovatus aquaticus]
MAVPRGRRALLRAAFAACALPGACAAPRETDGRLPPRPPAATLHLVARGWHTELALPGHALGGSPLGEALLPRFPEARWLLFGFGLRRYFTHPDPGPGDLLAALAPGPAAIRVSGFAPAPPEAFAAEDVVRLPVAAEGRARLLAFLWAELAKDARGAPLELPERHDPRGIFFAAATPYALDYNCNAWTARALHIAGLPVDPDGVVFAAQAMRRARAAALLAAG